MALAVNANISFLNSKSSGTLFATATELGEPKRLGAYDVIITDELGKIIARFNGMVYRKKQNLFARLIGDFHKHYSFVMLMKDSCNVA